MRRFDDILMMLDINLGLPKSLNFLLLLEQESHCIVSLLKQSEKSSPDVRMLVVRMYAEIMLCTGVH